MSGSSRSNEAHLIIARFRAFHFGISVQSTPQTHTPLHRNSGGLVREVHGVRPMAEMAYTFGHSVNPSFLCKQVPGPPASPWFRDPFLE